MLPKLNPNYLMTQGGGVVFIKMTTMLIHLGNSQWQYV